MQYAYCDLTTGICPHCKKRGEPNWKRACKLVPLLASREAMKCAHRGQQKLHNEICPTCCGNTEVFVFPCALHGKCTIEKRVVEHVCIECADNTVRARRAAETTGTTTTPETTI